MKTTKQIFKELNRKLLSNIMEVEIPVECVSFSDPADDVFNYSLKQNGLI